MKYSIFLITFYSNIIFAAVINPGDTDSLGCEVLNPDRPVCLSITLSGAIEEGDADRLQELIAHFESNGIVRIGKIHLDSMGGSLFEALRIGEIIRENKIFTSVDQSAVCYSSCSLIYMAGVYKVPFGEIGIHSFYSKDLLGSNRFDSANEGYEEVSATLIEYFRKMRVPQSLLDEMNKTPHNRIRILHGEELVDYGMIGFDPVYYQVRKCIRNCVPNAK